MQKCANVPIARARVLFVYFLGVFFGLIDDSQGLSGTVLFGSNYADFSTIRVIRVIRVIGVIRAIRGSLEGHNGVIRGLLGLLGGY